MHLIHYLLFKDEWREVGVKTVLYGDTDIDTDLKHVEASRIKRRKSESAHELPAFVCSAGWIRSLP